jgi:uncharacterized membrane protein
MTAEATTSHPKRQLATRSLVYLTAGLLLIGWLLNTPAGLLGKADAIGYAVCHRLDFRSFHIGDRAIALCARCSGMYLGAVLGLIYQLVLGRRRTKLPPKSILWVMGLFFAAFAVDGTHSLFQLVRGEGFLYQTTNTIRLITGTGMGLTIALIFYPTFNQTIWTRISARPAIENWKQFAGLLALSALLVWLVLTENPLILYPLSLISAAGVLGILTLLYGMVVLMVLKQENYISKARQLIFPLTAGFILALAQIALIDLGRFWLTGTWGGFPSPFGG